MLPNTPPQSDEAPAQDVGWCPSPAVSQADQSHVMEVFLQGMASLAEEVAQLKQRLPEPQQALQPNPHHAE